MNNPLNSRIRVKRESASAADLLWLQVTLLALELAHPQVGMPEKPCQLRK